MLKVSKATLSEAEEKAMVGVLRAGYLGMGTQVKQFEDELQKYLGGDFGVVCVNTGTSALHLALQAIGLQAGDEVLVPSLTYVASFQAVSATGATPVACDVEGDTGLLDLKDAEKRLTLHTKAILPVHYASEVSHLENTYHFAKKHSLRIVEDAAHAFGCTINGKKVGSVGDIVCFSFDGIKNITSGEGGAVVTSDKKVLSRVKDARLLGVENDSDKRYTGHRSWDFDVFSQGWRYHMSDLMASLGRVQLARFESDFKPKRMQIARYYREVLNKVENIKLFKTTGDNVVPHIFPVRVLNQKRDDLRQFLLKAEVETGIHYKPAHLLTRYGQGSVSLPVVEKLYQEILTLPLYPSMQETDCRHVVDEIKKFFL